MAVLLDFERYPSFVPGVLRARVKSAGAAQKDAVEVEAMVKNTKFSGTLRVLVQADRPAGRILVSHRFGPFKTLSAAFNVVGLSPQSAEVRCDMEIAPSLSALTTLVNSHLKAAADAYADVFVRELARASEASLSSTQ